MIRSSETCTMPEKAIGDAETKRVTNRLLVTRVDNTHHQLGFAHAPGMARVTREFSQHASYPPHQSTNTLYLWSTSLCNYNLHANKHIIHYNHDINL